jgi:xanthine dehydrogenase accessory factor
VIATLDRQSRAVLDECARAGRDCVIVAIDRVEGSVPRERGAAMVVTGGHAVGTIGGGHLELKSIAIGREMLARPADPSAAASLRRFPLGPALGQCCGGVAHVGFYLCTAGIAPASLEVRVPVPMFNLRLFGAGHIGQALIDVLAAVDCEISWVDSREQQFPARVPPNARVEFSEAPEEEVAAAPAGAFYLVMTHSHALDLAIVERILRRGDAGFIGLIGSHTKRVTFERRLRERGIAPSALEAMVCPIGVPGIAGKAPGVVAVAVAAQLLVATNAQTGACVDAGKAKPEQRRTNHGNLES